MLPQADLALYDRDDRLIAVAEVKTKLGTSREWAAQLRRNILAHGGFRAADFFLVVTPDRLYVWKGAGNEPAIVPPTYEMDTRPILEPYFEGTSVDADSISGPAFELVVGAWLSDLIRSETEPEKLSKEEGQLAESGLLSAIKSGRVEYEAAA